MCGDSIALATEREGAWRQPRSGLKSERLPGQGVCGLAPLANGLVTADDSDAIRHAAAYEKQGPSGRRVHHRVVPLRLHVDRRM